MAVRALDEAVLAELRAIKMSGASRLTDDAMRRLDFLLQGALLERALEHIDAGDVTRVVAPSGASCFLVASSSGRSKRGGGQGGGDGGGSFASGPAKTAGGGGGGGAASSGGASAPVVPAAAAAAAAAPYVVLLDGPGHCACFDFASRVVMGRENPGWNSGGGGAVAGGGAPLIPLDTAAATTRLPLAPLLGRGGGAAAAEEKEAREPPSFEQRRFCKHLLAAMLADALGPSRYSEQAVAEEGLIALVAGRKGLGL